MDFQSLGGVLLDVAYKPNSSICYYNLSKLRRWSNFITSWPSLVMAPFPVERTEELNPSALAFCHYMENKVN